MVTGYSHPPQARVISWIKAPDSKVQLDYCCSWLSVPSWSVHCGLLEIGRWVLSPVADPQAVKEERWGANPIVNQSPLPCCPFPAPAML